MSQAVGSPTLVIAGSSAAASVASLSVSLIDNIPTAIAYTTQMVGTPVVAAPPAATSVNQTQIIGQEKQAQRQLSRAMPIYLTITLGALVVLLMILSHPRFLARLFASVHRKRTAAAEEAARPAYAFDMAHSKKVASVNSTPRVVAGGDLTKGWFLRSGNRDAPVASAATIGEKQDPFSSAHSLPAGVKTDRSLLAPPPHIPSLTSRLPFHSLLESSPFARWPTPFCTRADLKTIIVVVVYLVACVVACTYKSVLNPPKANVSGYGSDYARTGLIAMCQAPIAVALGVRGNIIGLLLGKSYDRIRIVHKVSGRIVFTGSLVHSAFFLYKWASVGKLREKSATPIGITGIIAFVGVSLLAVTSLPAFRRYTYGMFKISHYIGVIMFLAGLGAHVPVAVPWVWASGILYLVSVVTQFLKTRFARADLVALGGCTTTVITIPSVTTGWRAGQHVRLRVFGLGLKNSFEAHPFTIASAPDCGGMVLMAKAAGNWTEDLYKLAASGGVASKPSDLEGGVWHKSARVMIEGPYGGPGNTLPLSFSSLCLVAGGSGISHAIGVAQDLIARSPSGVVGARTVDIIWVVRVQQTAKAIMPTLTALVEQARSWERKALALRRKGHDVAMPTALRVHIFVTRVPDSSPLTLVNEKRMSKWERASKLFPASQPNSALGHDDNEMEDLEMVSSSDDDSSEGHGTSSQDHGDADWCVDNDPTFKHHGTGAPQRQPSAAEKTKADWLERNPSNASVARLHERMTDWTRPMSSMSAYRGRPELKTVVTTIVEETMGRHGRALLEPTGVFVTCCGPEFLVNDARDAARTVQPWKARAAGGVEFEAEFFGF